MVNRCKTPAQDYIAYQILALSIVNVIFVKRFNFLKRLHFKLMFLKHQVYFATEFNKQFQNRLMIINRKLFNKLPRFGHIGNILDKFLWRS